MNIKDHIKIPLFPSGMPPNNNAKYLDDYISYTAMEKLPKNKPLWEIHIVNYPTSNDTAGTLIFKLHHSLGDGFSLVGALLSCLQRADNPSLPLTFPTAPLRLTRDEDSNSNGNLFNKLSKFFSVVRNTVSDFCTSIVKSSFLEDDKSPIRSGDVGVEFRPITTATTTFSLDRIKQIKTSMGAVCLNIK